MLKKWLYGLGLLLAACMALPSCEIDRPLDYLGRERSPFLVGILSPDSIISLRIGLTSLLLVPGSEPEMLENATVELFEEGLSLGLLAHQGNGVYALPGRFALPDKHYSVSASVPGFPPLRARTYVPPPVQGQACHFLSLPERWAGGVVGIHLSMKDQPQQTNAYWMDVAFKGYWHEKAASVFEMDSSIVSFQLGQLYTLSPLVDDFNTTHAYGFREHWSMVRVTDAGFANDSLHLDFHRISQASGVQRYDALANYDENQGLYVRVINASEDYDRFLKTTHIRYMSNPPQGKGDTTIPYPFPDNTVVHSNVENGTGIFAGYSLQLITAHLVPCP
jgi:hypothetical protein